MNNDSEPKLSAWDILGRCARWVVFLPLGFAAAMLVPYFVVLFLENWTILHSQGAVGGPIISAISSGVAGVFGVGAAVTIAPTPRKMIPGAAMATVLGLLAVFGIVVAFQRGDWSGGASAVALAVGVAFGLQVAAVFEREQSQKLGAREAK